MQEELKMATITKRGNTYRIRTSCGYSVDGKQVVKSMTYKPREGMSEKQIEKEVRRQAVLFEESCKKGQTVTAAKFETFARAIQYPVDGCNGYMISGRMMDQFMVPAYSDGLYLLTLLAVLTGIEAKAAHPLQLSQNGEARVCGLRPYPC